MQRFRLKSDITAIEYPNGDKGVAIVIPAGSVVATSEPVDVLPVSDRSKLIIVLWGGKALRMFLSDLLERGERARWSVQLGSD